MQLECAMQRTQLQVVMKLAHPRYPQPEYDDKVLIVIGAPRGTPGCGTGRSKQNSPADVRVDPSTYGDWNAT